jgi:hypothetical protein
MATEPVPVRPTKGLEDVRLAGYDWVTIDGTGTRLDVVFVMQRDCEGLDHVEVTPGSGAIDVALYLGEVPGVRCQGRAMRALTTVGLPAAVMTGGSPPVTLFDIQGLVVTPCSSPAGCRYGMSMPDVANGFGLDSWFVGDPDGWMRNGPGAGLASTYQLRAGIVPVDPPPPHDYVDAAALAIGGCETPIVPPADGPSTTTVRVLFDGDGCTISVTTTRP